MKILGNQPSIGAVKRVFSRRLNLIFSVLMVIVAASVPLGMGAFNNTGPLHKTMVSLRSKEVKAQSAMEYLMTYGWAILIIAVVLGALFSLGVFSSNNSLGTSCISNAGYLCSNPQIHGGTLTVNVGQLTGSSWTTVNVLLVETGAPAPTTSSFALSCAQQFSSGINNGQQVAMSVTGGITSGGACTALPSSVGTAVSGAVWAQYTVGSNSGLIAKLAGISVKVS
ncbi:MAG: hypothetical protein KGH57_00340 [Candidatus Micrarchaeota archaeon]|nr:hypothetical protein [Candidatus Micrarchaeota archaeon]